MSDRNKRVQSPFRLDLEQQKKRAMELLRDAKAGDAAALRRIAADCSKATETGSHHFATGALGLADAQRAIARELGIASWVGLQAHIVAMDAARASLEYTDVALDADQRTLHVRCGSDIRSTLTDAGFAGDFLEHAYPYVQGPVTDDDNSLTLRAEFLVGAFGGHLQATFADVLARCHDEEQRLASSARDYERIVLWMEHDSYDQLVLVRCLASYARVGAPRVLELVATGRFPGTTRFIGLGQLPPEALRLLWSQRRAVTTEQLDLGAEAWRALSSDDPRMLAAIMRTGTSALPLLAPALHRHLRELPSVENGLSLTEQLILEILAEQSMDMAHAFVSLRDEREQLPWLGDWGFDHIVECMWRSSSALIERTKDANCWMLDRLAITDRGRAVLSGTTDWLSLAPPARWVGGVRIEPGGRNWRWDEARREVVHV
jgi:hypothetical protein